MQNDRKERGRLVRFLRRQELLITVLLSCLYAALSVWRVAERAVWLLRDFKPLRIPYETELMIVHESTILLFALLSVWTAVGCLRLHFGTGRPRVGLLRGAVLAHMWLGRLMALICVAAAGGITWLAVYYRLSAAFVGWVGLISAVVLFCCVTRVRFWRNLARILKDARARSRDGVRGHLRFQSLVVMLSSLLPVIAVSLESVFITGLTAAVRKVLPVVSAASVREMLSRAGGMYVTDILRTASGAAACGMVYLLYSSYRASYGDALTSRLHDRLNRRKNEPERPVKRDPGRKPWGKGV